MTLPWRAVARPAGLSQRLRARLRSALSACVLAALLLLLLLQTPAPAAWDAGRMLTAAQAHNARAVAGVRALHALVGATQALPERTRLEAMNRFFNERIAFVEDSDTVGTADDWASPVELMARGAGDCEDYSIAKYFGLIGAGVPSEKLRMVYVRAELGGSVRAHMVLAYYASVGAEPLVLDNLQGNIRPASQRPDLKAVFSFNAEGLWKGTGKTGAGDPVARLSRWRDVLAKARSEGFL